jgi:hypothetical protein
VVICVFFWHSLSYAKRTSTEDRPGKRKGYGLPTMLLCKSLFESSTHKDAVCFTGFTERIGEAEVLEIHHEEE